MKFDKEIKIIGFRNDELFIVENRSLWSEIVLREVHCDKCGDVDELTFHTKDIPKLIRALNILMKIQNKKQKSWMKTKPKNRK